MPLAGVAVCARFLKALNTKLPLRLSMAYLKLPGPDKHLKDYSVTRIRGIHCHNMGKGGAR